MNVCGKGGKQDFVYFLKKWIEELAIILIPLLLFIYNYISQVHLIQISSFCLNNINVCEDTFLEEKEMALLRETRT